MAATSTRAIWLIVPFCLSTSLAAATADTKPPVITAAASGESVRFASPGPIAQIRVQVLSANGDAVFDSAWRDGNVLDWPSGSLASGTYRCVVMVRDLEGNVTQKESTLTAHDGKVSIEDRAGVEPKVTLLAHDGSSGEIVSTAGDLSFRFGDFLAGKDIERMRLTANGDLQVDGVIRATNGILLPDGTVLTTAAGLPTVGAAKPPRAAIVGPLKPNTLIPGASFVRKPQPAASPDYQFKVDAAGVHIGTTNAFGLDVAGNVTLASNLLLPATSSASAGVIMQGGSTFAHTYGTQNVFVGPGTGNFTLTGSYNTALGYQALTSDTVGNNNTAFGWKALNNSTGASNTGIGYGALYTNTSGCCNTAVGSNALINTTGLSNIGIGLNAGMNLTTGWRNIMIGNDGVAGEGNTIRIGTNGDQLKAFMAGIRGVSPGLNDAVGVVIDSNGQLAAPVIVSSRRYKFDINDMDSVTDGLMQLRPVTFRYLAHGDNAPLQYGLIAEEVAEVYPELVTRNKDGEVETVLYQFLAPMLLNELQKEHRKNEEQQNTISTLQATIDSFGRRLEALERSR